MARRRYPPITQKSDGYWHAWVTVGTKPNGRPDQRHVKRADKAAVEERIDELLEQVRSASVVRAGRSMTLRRWMETYLDTVAPLRCDPGTVKDYRSKCQLYVYPVIGKIRLDKLGPEHLDEVYLTMQRNNLAASTRLKTHSILKRALKIAARRKLLPRNPADLVDAPSTRPVEQQALTLADARRVLAEAAVRRNSVRWSVALGLGLRQGEALGLRWSYLDLDKREMRVHWQLRRRSFEHGCPRQGDQPTCGRRKAGYCPAKVMPLRQGERLIEGGLILKPPKGTGRRTAPVPETLAQALRAHREGQKLERVLAGDAWIDNDLVFCEPTGRPIDPGRDYKEWTAILKAAQVDHARLHDGRHTAGTILHALGVPIRVVQEILGHSDVRTTQRYTHVASEMARAAASQIDSALFGSDVHPEVRP